jgi:DNA-directed RNA polymerase subunit M/transcription elongation factor TFIIS
MSETTNTCPKCGSDSYDTIKHDWRDGVTPFDTYHVCCSCEHEWIEDEFNQLGEQQ